MTQSYPGVKTNVGINAENEYLIGARIIPPIPAYYTLSFNNDPNFMLDPILVGNEYIYPETPGYFEGIIIPNHELTSISGDPEYEDPASPGNVLKCEINSITDYLVDPNDKKILQMVVHKRQNQHVLNQEVNRVAIYTADDVLLSILHFTPVIWGTGELYYTVRLQYIDARTLEDIKAGNIDKQVLADARIEGIANNIARLQGLMVDHTAGSEFQINELSATDNVLDLDSLSGKIHILEGNHQIGTKSLSNIEFSRHYNGVLDLIGEKASGYINITDNSVIDGDTFTVNGVDFVEGVDFVKGANKEISAEALKTAINNSSDPLLNDIIASRTGAVITTEFANIGIIGNGSTLAYLDSGSGVSASISGANFTGGTDFSVLTLTGNLKGALKVINAADNSVVVSGNCDGLFIESDNVNCLDNSSGTGFHTLNGKLSNPELLTVPPIDDDSSKLTTTSWVRSIFEVLDSNTIEDGIDCSSNPNYPAADKGHLYYVSAAGKIGGPSGPDVEAGDCIICKYDDTPSDEHSVVGSSWIILQTNIDPSFYITVSDIVDNLTSTDDDKPLSANQGKVLYDGKLEKSQNLNDLQDKATARSNLDVYQKSGLVVIDGNGIEVSGPSKTQSLHFTGLVTLTDSGNISESATVTLLAGTASWAPNLPPAANVVGKMLHIKAIGTGNYTITANPGDYLEDLLDGTFLMDTQFESITLIAYDASHWYLV